MTMPNSLNLHEDDRRIVDDRRRADDQGSLWWIQPVFKFVGTYGLGGGIAVVLIWFILGNVTRNQNRQADDMQQLLALTNQMRVDMSNHIVQMEQSSRYLRLICVSIAKNPQDRNECLR